MYKQTLYAYLQESLSTDFEVLAAAAAAAVVAVGKRLTLEGRQLDWQTEDWGAGVQPQGRFPLWPTGFGGGPTGQPA